VALDLRQAALVVSVRDEQGSIVMRAGDRRNRGEADRRADAWSWLSVMWPSKKECRRGWLHDLLKPHAERVPSPRLV